MAPEARGNSPWMGKTYRTSFPNIWAQRLSRLLLAWDPAHRISACAALQQLYFDGMDASCIAKSNGRNDKPGNHNFELLKMLVLPDGSILRARLRGRPTRDCLFTDPARDDSLTGFIRGRDVHLIAEASTEPNWNGDCAVYCHRSGELTILPYNTALPVSLKVLEHDIFTVTPIKVLAPGFGFAPLGLINMFNVGGAIEGLRYEVKVGGA
ncbi:probable galactinol--sucrose galactosyltransferase 6 isoform X2 [Fagus crenata]